MINLQEGGHTHTRNYHEAILLSHKVKNDQAGVHPQANGNNGNRCGNHANNNNPWAVRSRIYGQLLDVSLPAHLERYRLRGFQAGENDGLGMLFMPSLRRTSTLLHLTRCPLSKPSPQNRPSRNAAKRAIGLSATRLRRLRRLRWRPSRSRIRGRSTVPAVDQILGWDWMILFKQWSSRLVAAEREG
jgi:hypothetical protein